MTLPIFALALAAFGIGTTEFVIMGLLQDLSTDLSVSTAQAGLLVSGYALGVVIGGPIFTVASSRWPRRLTLLTLVGIFIAGNLACALSPTYNTLMGSRILTSLAHGAFFGIGSVTAANIAPPGQRGKAIAAVFSGLTIANVLGVPIGTAIGQHFGWRATFWAVAMAGTVAFAALWYWLPTTLQRGTGRITREFRVLKDVAALVALGMSALAAISMFATMTYIAPLLTDVTGIKASSITLFLLVYGLGLTVGSHLGGRLSKGYLLKPLVRLMIGTIVLLLGFIVALPYFWSALTLLFLWGAISFAIMPMLQLLIVDQSVEAPNLASTLNQSAFNLGNAIGAWAGGVWVGMGLSLQYLPALSAAFMAVAAVTAYGAKRLFARHAAEIGDTTLQYEAP